MTLTIVSAQYANAEQTAAVLQTIEAGAVLVSEADTPQLWDQMLAGEVAAYAPPNMRPAVLDEFRLTFRPAVTDALGGIAGRRGRAGDMEFATALDALAEKVVVLDEHPLFLAAPAVNIVTLRAAMRSAYLMEVAEVLGPVAAQDPAKAQAWAAVVTKVLPK